MAELVGVFLEHGLLGVISLIALWFAFRKDRETTALHESHAERLVTLNKEHKAEMTAFQERYIAKAETWMAKYHDMASAQTDVLTSLERRWGK